MNRPRIPFNLWYKNECWDLLFRTGSLRSANTELSDLKGVEVHQHPLHFVGEAFILYNIKPPRRETYKGGVFRRV